MLLMRVRFAPSPTGHLHVGNARTALFNWLLARGQNGTFILRIEDTDLERSTRASEQAILEDLRWMGLQWDEGVEAGGAYGPYRQTERMQSYVDHTNRLLAEGKGYYCFCSAETLEAHRKAQLAAGLPPKYAGTCRNIPADEAKRRKESGEAAVVRLRVPEGRNVTFNDVVRGEVTFHTDVIGDPVLVRSDGIPAYNFAVVIDDALMKVTHVIRGEDHISNTPRQILLYEAYGYQPPAFAHLSLVMGPDHAPLSKRHGATSVKEFRDKGYLPEALVNYLALIGWSPGQNEELLPGRRARAPFPPRKRRAQRRRVRRRQAGVGESSLPEGRAIPIDWRRSPSRTCASADRSSGDLSADARAWLVSVLPGMAQSVDRLPQLADRLDSVFQLPGADRADRCGAREGAGRGARRLAAPDRQGCVSCPRESRQGSHRPQGQEPVPPDPRDPDRFARGPRARSDRARDRSRRRLGGLAPVIGCRERAAAVAGLS